MILYHPDKHFHFTDYGIQIPVLDSRAALTFEHLCKDPFLGARISLWHRLPTGGLVSQSDLERVHSPEYIADLYSPRLEKRLLEAYELVNPDGTYHRYDPERAVKPLEELLQYNLDAVSATFEASLLALENGFVYSFRGGMHHGHYDFGHGFCLINDIVIAARKLQDTNSAGVIWVIDTDVHKGDGTAALTKNDPSIITLSIHMKNGWPLDLDPYRPDGTLHPSFIESDIDIPVGEGEERYYLTELEKGLALLKKYSRPDLAIVVDGADPYEKDELPSTGLLNLTLEQMLERDRMVYDFLISENIPSAWLIAGGYGRYSWEVYTAFLSETLKKRLL